MPSWFRVEVRCDSCRLCGQGRNNGDQKCLPNFASQLFFKFCLTLAFHAGSLLLLKIFDFLGVPTLLTCLKFACLSLKVMIKACLLHQEVPRDDLEPRSHDSTYSGKVFHVFNPRSPSTLERKDSGEKSCKEKFDIVLQPRLVDHGAHYSFILLEEVLW